MCSTTNLFASLVCLIFLISFASFIDGIGFPSGGGGGGCCCSSGGGGGGGGGCGGGCGRKKREVAAVQPHYKTDETTPCPQAAWKQIMDGAIIRDDPIGSINAIQTRLYQQYDGHKFLVICTILSTKKVNFSSSGDGYCGVAKEGIWCQTAALTA